MKDIHDLIENISSNKNVILQKPFQSKKNIVVYVTINGKPRVLKWFLPGFRHRIQIESNILKESSSELNMPYLYELDEKNNVLIMSYIIGDNLCDVINDEKTTFSEKDRLMVLLSKWYARFHAFYKTSEGFLIRGDSILRNFILSDRIWGVDFEESRPGEPLEDIAELCGSILSTDPMFTLEKFNLCKIFIDSYKKNVDWKLGNVNDELSYALLKNIQWRPEDEIILRNYSARVKKQGLT